MVTSINLLRLFGLDRRAADFLNSHARNKALWSRVQSGGAILIVFALIGIFIEGALLTHAIGNGAVLMAALLLNSIATLVVVETVQVAQGYQDNRKLVLFGNEGWVMLTQ